ncbi:MAG: hypothetical protein ACLFN2_02185 [Bacteroidales bacterium]
MKRFILYAGLVLILASWLPGKLVFGQDITDSPGLQDDEGPTLVISYGLNTGVYLAHKGTANYYNGSGRNSLEDAINRRHNYNRIRESLNYDFELDQLPADMAYSPAIMVGIFGGLHFTEETALYGTANFTRLSAQDQFTLELERPSFIEGDNIEAYSVYGKEERSEIWIGLRHTFHQSQTYLHPYLEFGGSLTATRIRQNNIRIEGHTYSIRKPTDTYYNVRDDGIGFGAYAGAGARMDVGDSYAFDLGFNSNYAKINLGEYNSYHLQFSLFVRLYLNHGPSRTR